MSEKTDQTSSREMSSVAEQLKAAGFHKTSIVRAVAELVGEYLGIHANIGTNLVTALGKANNDALEVLGTKKLEEPIQTPKIDDTKKSI